ncbi:MAG: hypothetical protein ACFFAO_21335, partial [Candidatus Hermodarchaeota archaeon]
NLKVILPAHGMVIKNPAKRIAEILRHREERMQQVIDLVKNNSNNGISAGGILKELYPNANKTMEQVARGWICLTLKILEEKGLATRLLDKSEYKFRPTNKL